MGYRRFQIGCVFVEYDLFNFYITTFIQNWIYMNFRINFTQFYINFSRQEHLIDVAYVTSNAWDSQVSSYTPFHFSFTVPLILGEKIHKALYIFLLCSVVAKHKEDLNNIWKKKMYRVTHKQWDCNDDLKHIKYSNMMIKFSHLSWKLKLRLRLINLEIKKKSG